MKRIRVCIECMQRISASQFRRTVASLTFEKCVDFNEGDTGLPGCVQRYEAASLYPTNTDRIRRYGGPTCPSAQWPDEADTDAPEEQRFEILEGKITNLF